MYNKEEFNLYIKKNTFSTYMLILSISFLYFFYLYTDKNSLQHLDDSLSEYSTKILEMKESVKNINEKFQDMRNKKEIISKFDNYFHCNMDVDSQLSNFFRFEIPQGKFDFTRNVNIIYDPKIKINRTTNFSFSHEFQTNSDSIILEFRKDSYGAEENLMVNSICYFLIGFRK